MLAVQLPSVLDAPALEPARSLSSAVSDAFAELKKSAMRILRVARLALNELASLALLIVLTPLSWLRMTAMGDHPPSALRRPILLVHGYLHNDSGWIYLAQSIRRAGYGPIYTVNLGQPLESVSTHALSVADKLKSIRETHPDSSPILIGHSMGGMVASYFNEFLAAQGHATDVITLGSPLQGTTMFDYGIGEAANDMEWQGPFATALVEKMRENRHGVRYYHIAFRNDNLVVPFEAALTGADPSREIVLDDVGHLSTLFSRCVAEIIVTWLAELHSPLEGRNLCQIDLGSPAPDTRCAVQ